MHAAINYPSTTQPHVGYAAIATGQLSCCCSSQRSNHADPVRLAEAIGYYDAESLAKLPDGANMGLSCGNPLAIASLQEGQAVLDLSSGGGFDVFQAGEKVKASGRVIGVDRRVTVRPFLHG